MNKYIVLISIFIFVMIMTAPREITINIGTLTVPFLIPLGSSKKK